MSEQTRKLVVYAVTLIVVVWGYFNLFEPKQKIANPIDTLPKASQVENIEEVVIKISDQLAEEYETKDWGKDPFYHTYPEQTSSINAR